ncbi:MAG: response regulator, partial [Chloroflexota bacterium]|nr:response regulator [Chloroflexota bacterium]
SIVIEVGDDGRGINGNLLIGAAIGARLITAEDARDLTTEQALSLMFRLGVSTSGAASGYVGALAGSGIGLADVAHAIHTLKGSITVQSEMGKGTVFRIRVPVSLSMQSVLEVSAGGQVFALPFNMVRSTGIVPAERLTERPTVEGAHGVREWRVVVDSAPEMAPDPEQDAAEEERVAAAPETFEVPAFAFAELLGFEQDAEKLRRMALVRWQGELVALLVESVGDADVREAAVRPLPRRYERRVVRGVVVRPEDGEVALLIDPHEALARRLSGGQVTLRPAGAPIERGAPSPTVLIVDDSVTIRRSLEQMLTAAGFATSQASDGREALEVMEKALPAVVVLDVEMPRLSGFELLTIMRSSPQYQQVRVAMLTTRAADKHRDYALALGADAYLVKPCPQETLIETIRRLLTTSEPA